MFDGDGNVLGIPRPIGFFSPELGLDVALGTAQGSAEPQASWESTDCTGPAYVLGHNRLHGPFPEGFPTFLVAPPVPRVPIVVRSEVDVQDSDECDEVSPRAASMTPAEPFDGVLPFSMPVAEPIYTGLAR